MRQRDQPRWWATGARWLLAAIFAATGLGKLLDVRGFAGVLSDYQVFPAAILLPLALGLAVLELLIAVGLSRRAWLHPAAVAAAGLSFGNAALLVVTLARGIALENCGCFGVFLARPLTLASPFEDVFLIGLAWLTWQGHRRWGGEPADTPGPRLVQRLP